MNNEMLNNVLNNDVLTEILLHLPVQSLLRFRAVCKFWAYVIDSPPFKKLHIHSNDSNKSDGTVYLQFSLSNGRIKLQHNRKSFILHESDHFKVFCSRYGDSDDRVRLYGPVKGLICIACPELSVPIAICNPFLGQLKLLPLTTSSSSNSPCRISCRSVAVGFDEDYKVVQLLSCEIHRRFHAHVYSRRTDSWRELAGDGGVLNDLEFETLSPVKSRCDSGHFAHWCVYRRKEGKMRSKEILSLDMKNEVFQTITLPADYVYSTIIAEDEHSFRRLVFSLSSFDESVKIYESRCEGNKLSWNHVMNVEVPSRWIHGWTSTGTYVFIEHWMGVLVYDYRACKFIGVLPKGSKIDEYRGLPKGSKIVEYRGSFVSLEN